jgi:dolichol-phosphate mannosyltransferase
LFNKKNLGVGGAVINGYKYSLKNNADIIVKIDGDGQMNPNLILDIIRPIINLEADYCKGNRFFYINHILKMPKIRIFGNAALSFITKLSSGYWDIFDPTNGFTAIHRSSLDLIPLDKLNKSFFFESDILFRLNTIKAVVTDVPMSPIYNDEISNLNIFVAMLSFPKYHTINFTKRIFYNYYLRGMSVSSFELPLGLILLIFGVIFGISEWVISIYSGITATFGTVMIASLSLLTGLQFILSFISFDIASIPKVPLQKKLSLKNENIK